MFSVWSTVALTHEVSKSGGLPARMPEISKNLINALCAIALSKCAIKNCKWLFDQRINLKVMKFLKSN